MPNASIAIDVYRRPAPARHGVDDPGAGDVVVVASPATGPMAVTVQATP